MHPVNARMRARFAEMKMEVLEVEEDAEEERVRHFLFRVVGRDENLHAQNIEIPLTFGRDSAEGQIIRRMDKALRTQERLWKLSGGRPPVRVAPDMDLGHLGVEEPLAWVLRQEKGEGAREYLRTCILDLLTSRQARKHLKLDRYGMTISGGVVHGRFGVVDGLKWKAGTLVAARTYLPETVRMALTSAPASAICDHPMLADPELTILSIVSKATLIRHTKGTTTFLVKTPTVPADKV